MLWRLNTSGHSALRRRSIWCVGRSRRAIDGGLIRSLRILSIGLLCEVLPG